MNAPRIADARDDELPALAPLLSRSRPLDPPYTPASLRRFASQEDAWCLAATVDGAIAAGATAVGGGVWRQPDRAFMVPAFIVDEAHRGRGIGTALADALESRAFGSGASRIVTSIHGDAEAALRFARARGFREFHRESWALLDLHAWRPRASPEIEGATVLSLGEALALPDAERAPLVTALSAAHRELLADVPASEIAFPHLAPADYERAILRHLDPDASLIALRPDQGATSRRTRGTDSAEVLALVLVRRGPLDVIVAAGEVGAGRGRKLIVALKVRAIDVLQRAGAQRVASLYDRDNAVTRQLNRSLGFERQAPHVRMELRR